ncbi:MAG: hypothetical protein WKF33_11200 [Thermoleophilaceae bacterium]|jgi:ABC-2 type transport system permease protein
MAVTFKTQQAGPLMQQGLFLAVFLSTVYTPQPLLRGWLAETAGLNPVRTCSSWPARRRWWASSRASPTRCRGSVALAGMGVFFGSLCLVGMRRMGR